MRRLSSAVLLLGAALLAGCAGSQPKAKSAEAPAKTSTAKSSGDEQPNAQDAPVKATDANIAAGHSRPKTHQSGNHDGIVMVNRQALHRAAAPAQVRPAELDIASLPMVRLPEPLETKDAPTALPHGIRNADEVRVRESGSTRVGSQERSVYVVIDKELGRMQIGRITANHHTGRQVYRRCGQERARIAPARWMTLSRKRGEVVLQLTDAWFDHKSCKMAVMRDTIVRPKPVLGGLWWTFRTRCESCSQKDWLVVLAPHLNNVNSSGMGVQPHVTNGSLSIMRLPLRRGGAATVSAHIQQHSVKQWQKALSTKLPEMESGQHIQVGMELMQTVSDEQPTAIVYATVQSFSRSMGRLRSHGF